VLQEIVGQRLHGADARILGGAVGNLAHGEIRDLGGLADLPPFTAAAEKLALDEAEQVVLKIGYWHGGNFL